MSSNPSICVNCKKIIIKKRADMTISDEVASNLGKRKMDMDTLNKERYGQDIPDDFFKTNIGHNVYGDKFHLNEAEILDWCYKYLASKNIRV
jgi:hypothetical protein